MFFCCYCLLSLFFFFSVRDWREIGVGGVLKGPVQPTLLLPTFPMSFQTSCPLVVRRGILSLYLIPEPGCLLLTFHLSGPVLPHILPRIVPSHSDFSSNAICTARSCPTAPSLSVILSKTFCYFHGLLTKSKSLVCLYVYHQS